MGTSGHTFSAMVNYVRTHNPPILVWENVVEVLSNIDYITSVFEALGYKMAFRKFCTSDFGLPQKRDRMYGVCISSHQAGMAPQENTKRKGARGNLCQTPQQKVTTYFNDPPGTIHTSRH